MHETIMNNPYDLDRNYFVLKCRQSIPYFKSISEAILKKMYFEAETKVYEYGQNLFDKGDKCEFISMVMSGVLSIELTDKVTLT